MVLSEEFKSTRTWDYALLVLEQDIDDITGYFDLNSLNLPQLDVKDAHIWLFK